MLSLKIEYLPHYTHEIWDYNKVEHDLINCSIENVDWSNLFLGENVHEQVGLLTKQNYFV